MSPIDLDENKSLSYFLNDNGEIGKGMYIGSAYQNFIEMQNHYLNILKESSNQRRFLQYKKKIKTIDIQKASKNNILNFEEIDKIFIEIIFENNKRNIYGENNNINFMNYKQNIYDFNSIENELREILLNNKTIFNDHEKLIFVTYQYEGFRNRKSDVLSDFNYKYQPIELNKEKNKKIKDYINNVLHNENNRILKIYFSIQLLIYYLTGVKKDKKDDLNIIIKNYLII